MRRFDAALTRLYYIAQTEMLTGGVIEAQVIGALRGQAAVDGQPRTKLLFLEPARVALGVRVRRVLSAYRSMWPEGKISVVPFVGRLSPASPGLFLAAYLAPERLRESPIVFHCRGAAATWSAHLARRFLGRGRVIFDLRGPAGPETIHRLGFPWPTDLTPHAEKAYRLVVESERRAVAVADRVFTISAGLKDYAIETLHAEADRVVVVPSCVASLGFDEETRQRVRRDWGIRSDETPVLVYSGRLGPERLPSHLFQVFAAVLRIRPEAKLVLFVYRNDVGDLASLLTRSGVPESAVVIGGYPRDEVLLRLCGGDVGMLFLEPALRYEHCLPIKFPEYLSAGLSVVMNSPVGQLPELVRARGLGWIIDPTSNDGALQAAVQGLIANLEREREALRRRSLDACSDLFLWRNHIPAIREAYGLAGFKQVG